MGIMYEPHEIPAPLPMRKVVCRACHWEGARWRPDRLKRPCPKCGRSDVVLGTRSSIRAAEKICEALAAQAAVFNRGRAVENLLAIPKRR